MLSPYQSTSAMANPVPEWAKLLQEAKEVLKKEQWISAEILPEIHGEYWCKMVDWREEYDDEWYETVYYSPNKEKAFGKGWNTADFDIVTYWRHITPPETSDND